MACNEGPDPADFAPGGLDPEDDPDNPEPSISIIDGVVVPDGSGRKMQFAIVLSNANYDDPVTVRADTSDGSATAPGMYTARSNATITFPVGTTEQTFEVTVLDPGNITGNAYFYVDLSNPSNGELGDSHAIGWAPYGGAEPPPPDDGLPTQYTGWPKPGVVYDEFRDDAYRYSCTAVACASAMAALIWRNRGRNVAQPEGGLTGDQGLDWKRLYRDAGGCTFCTGSAPSGCTGACLGENPATMLNWMRTTGIKETATGIFHKSRHTEIDRTGTMASIITKIKQAIKADGVVYIETPWYSDIDAGEPGWNRCFACNDFVLQNPTASAKYGRNDSDCTNLKAMTDSGLGHTWVLTGWNDNYKDTGGAFEIQSGHGRDWGSDGRCWLPYSYMGKTDAWHYWKMAYLSDETVVEEVIADAYDFVRRDVPYKLGAESRTQVDCSGLIYRIFTDTGHGALIGSARKLAAGYTRWFADNNRYTTDLSKRERGDLISYVDHPGDTHVSHIGIYLGDEKEISALVNPYGVTKHTWNDITVVPVGVCKVEYPNNNNFTAAASTTDPSDPEQEADPVGALPPQED